MIGFLIMISAPLSPFAAEQPSVLWHVAVKWLSKTSPPSFAQESFSSAPGVPGIDFEQPGIHGKVLDYSHFLLNFLLLFLSSRVAENRINPKYSSLY